MGDCREYAVPAGAKARVVFCVFEARLKAAPFQTVCETDSQHHEQELPSLDEGLQSREFME
jgi:hypothetical protein